MSFGTLKIATCQFAVSRAVERNLARIEEFLRKAQKSGADVVHFSECALSGYADTDFDSFEGFDWALLERCTKGVLDAAKELRLWVVLGSSHRLTEPNKPHNSLYLISPEGKIADRYDKRFCTAGDLQHYTPGDHFTYFTINGIKCSMLICFDLRFPELYRQLAKAGMNCVFQSFCNSRLSGPSVHTHIMRQTMQAHAGTNYFWVSMANASTPFSPYPSCFIQPDGKIVKQLRANRAGMMVNTVDINKEFYDPSKLFRQMAIEGKLSNGSGEINDPRSKDRTVY